MAIQTLATSVTSKYRKNMIVTHVLHSLIWPWCCHLAHDILHRHLCAGLVISQGTAQIRSQVIWIGGPETFPAKTGLGASFVRCLWAAGTFQRDE